MHNNNFAKPKRLETFGVMNGHAQRLKNHSKSPSSFFNADEQDAQDMELSPRQAIGANQSIRTIGIQGKFKTAHLAKQSGVSNTSN